MANVAIHPDDLKKGAQSETDLFQGVPKTNGRLPITICTMRLSHSILNDYTVATWPANYD